MASPPVATLNPLDCNLDIELRDGNLTCSKLSNDGFGYMWAGCRGNVGLMEGKAFFRVRILQPLPVNVRNTDDLATAHLARIGVSYLETPVGQLGEVRELRSCMHGQIAKQADPAGLQLLGLWRIGEEGE